MADVEELLQALMAAEQRAARLRAIAAATRTWATLRAIAAATPRRSEVYWTNAGRLVAAEQALADVVAALPDEA